MDWGGSPTGEINDDIVFALQIAGEQAGKVKWVHSFPAQNIDEIATDTSFVAVCTISQDEVPSHYIHILDLQSGQTIKRLAIPPWQAIRLSLTSSYVLVITSAGYIYLDFMMN